MAYYVGLDIHKTVVEAAIIDPGGALVHRARFACTREQIEGFAAVCLHADDHVAVEATTNTWPIVDLLTPRVASVVVSNPLRTRAIAEAKIKTDKVDALVLAQLLRADYLPQVWQPDPVTRALRLLTSRRAALVADRIRLKNRLHAELAQRLIPLPSGLDDLFSARGRQWLAELGPALDAVAEAALASTLRLLEAVEAEVAAVEQTLACCGYQDPRVKLLLTIPGVNVTVAQTLLAALGDISRFRDGDHAASYLGLVPSTRQSAHRTYHGPITRTGNSHARWVLVQAAQHVARHPGPLGHTFRRLAKRKGRNIAVVAIARKLVVIAWHMVTTNEPYRYAEPRSTAAKLGALRIAATGQRRRKGVAKGTPPSEYHGRGGVRTIPSLTVVCAAEGVPPPRPLSRGEQRTVELSHAAAYVRDIHTTRRVPMATTRRPAT
jgi:transposase